MPEHDAGSNHQHLLPRIEILAVAKEQIKDLIDVRLLMEVLGFKITSSNRNEIRAACIIHGGDNPTSFRMRLETKRFICFSHKCEGHPSKLENDIFDLVMKVKKISFMEAFRFLADMVGIDLDTVKFDEGLLTAIRYKKDIMAHLSNVNRVKEKRQRLPELSEDLIEGYRLGRTSYFQDMGIPEYVLDFFEIGHMTDSHGIPRETIPIRDADGRLVSVSARRTDGDDEPRYLLLKEFKKRRSLYNIHNAIKVKEAFDNCVIIVEGFKAAWAVHNSGSPNVVACMGAYLAESQAQLAAEKGFLKCVLMFDGDEPGKEGAIRSFFIARKYMKTNVIKLYEIFPDLSLSPDDLSPEALNDIIMGHIRF